MPFSHVGTGTSLLQASKSRSVDGRRQFEAVEAVTFLGMPLIPYRCLHVTFVSEDILGGEYESIPLRMSGRLVLKAFLSRWGILLMVFGIVSCGALALLDGKKVMQTPMFWNCFAVVMLGVACALAWYVLNFQGERLKNLMGAHEFGFSDPFMWTDQFARGVIGDLHTQHGGDSLTELGRRLKDQGAVGRAIFVVRLAMRDRRDVDAKELFRELLRDAST